MTTIKILTLQTVGSELFEDSESFLNELNDQEIDILQGAGLEIPQVTVTVAIGSKAGKGLIVSRNSFVNTKIYSGIKSTIKPLNRNASVVEINLDL
jgi:hypothetical protein